ncbi:hypothetical protein CIY_03300 [Butyrivibrio fibrisolvens 16/4]|nr:hypothetical protein CIY_03300 [Butyrivibrio fibrisolvens 16/4]
MFKDMFERDSSLSFEVFPPKKTTNSITASKS